MKWLQKDGTSGKNVPLLLLLAVGVIEFLFITLESRFSGIGYYLAETYVIVPCLLFLGYVLREKPAVFARRRLLLAVAAVSWFVITQIQHTLSGMENHPMTTVFFVYLMAFPFASLSDDRDNRGLWLIGGMFLAASLVLVYYSLLLFLGWVPADLAELIYWDGARLFALWHPNISSCFFMIGIGFAAVFLFQTKKPLAKVLLLMAILLQFVAMSLTNCRTTLLLIGALFGGIVFFLLAKGGVVRFVLGLAAAALVLVGSFEISGEIFMWNNNRIISGISAEETMAAEIQQVPEISEITYADAVQKEMSHAMLLSAETETQELTQEQLHIIESTQRDVLRVLEVERKNIWNPALAEEMAVLMEKNPEILLDQGLIEDLIVYMIDGEDYYEEPLSLEQIIALRTADDDHYYQTGDGTNVLQSDNVQGSLTSDMRTLNGRTYIWKAAVSALRDNSTLRLWGTEYVGTVISYYNRFEVVHSHNSWMEALMRMGLPGLLISLIFTALSAWSAARLVLSRKTELWKKIIAMLTMCVMASGFLEPYLFITNVYYHVTDFAFFFLTGYLDYWCRPLKE